MTKDAMIVLPGDVFIPGFSVLEIGAVLQGKIDGRTIMVERKELREPLVLLATCIVEPKSSTKNPTVPVRLMNLSSEGVTIYKGTRVGQASVLRESEFVVAGISEDGNRRWACFPLLQSNSCCGKPLKLLQMTSH